MPGSTEVVTVLVAQGSAVVKSTADGTRDTLSPADDWGFARPTRGKPVEITATPGKIGFWRLSITNRTKVPVEVTTEVRREELTDIIEPGEARRFKQSAIAKLTVVRD